MKNRIFDIQQQPKSKTFCYYKAGEWRNINFKTYAEQADFLSCILFDKGIRKGDHIMSISQNRPEWNILDRALAQIGAIHVSLFPTFSKENLSHILASVKPKLIFVTGLLLEKTISDLLENKNDKIIRFGSDGENGFETFIAITPNTSAKELQEIKQQVNEEDIVSLIYTSGTSATPKGIAHSHDDLFKYAAVHKSIYQLSSNDVALSFLPLCHGFERAHNYYCQMLGIPVYYASSQENVLQLLQYTKASFITAVPNILEGLYTLVNNAGGVDILKSTTNLKVVASSGASLPEYLLNFLNEAEITVVESYGLTECLGVTSNNTNASKANSVGKPLPYVKLKISDEDEILVNSSTSLKYALINNKVTKPEFKDGAWYPSGDAGFIDNEGYLFITGRKKDRFKTTAGRYISPVEIENELKSSNLINQALVVGYNKPYIAAIILASIKPGEKEQIKQLIENYNKGKLPSEQIKEHLVIEDEWTVEGGELTHNKKVRRNFLEKKYAEYINELFTGV